MAIKARKAKGILILGITVAGWTAVLSLFLITMTSWPIGYIANRHLPFNATSLGWGQLALAVAISVGALAAGLIIIKDSTRSDDDQPWQNDWIHASGLLLCAGAWFVGGMWNLLAYGGLIPSGGAYLPWQGGCGGSGYLHWWDCAHEPDPFLKFSGIILSLFAAAMGFVQLRLAVNRARLWAFLAAPFILGIYLLGFLMWAAHEGLGSG